MSTNRRDILRIGSASFAIPLLAMLDVGCAPNDEETTTASVGDDEASDTNEDQSQDTSSDESTETTDKKESAMKIQYLEIVSPDVDALCKTYEGLYGVKFGEPVMNLGNARTADLPDGGWLGIRAPLRPDEKPVVRPYFLVEDIKDCVAKAGEAGAEIAVPPMELPGYGTCAIFIQGGAENGLWQM